MTPSSPYDWRSGQNDGLWQGVNGINNPCPGGFRLPTEAEFNAEMATWASNNAAGAFASPLKLPLAGSRSSLNNALNFVGTRGYYWTSTISSTIGGRSIAVTFKSNSAVMFNSYRAVAKSVRCIYDN